MGRLKPGVTIEQAQQEMNAIANELARRHPASNREWGVRVEPFKNNFFEASAQKNLWLLLAAVSLVVLIACVNIAHLLLSRGMARAREIAIRAALGASRARLARFTVTESLVLALMGGGLGVLSSIWILQSIVALVPSFQMSAEADPQLSLPVLTFTALATLLCGLMFGSVAVWHAGRVDVAATLKQGGHGHAGPSRQRLRRAFVLAQFALAVTLLGGAGLTIYRFWNGMRADLGMNPERVLTMSLTLPEQRFGTDVRMTSFLISDCSPSSRRCRAWHMRASPPISH